MSHTIVIRPRINPLEDNDSIIIQLRQPSPWDPPAHLDERARRTLIQILNGQPTDMTPDGAIPPPPIAADQEATATGDPHIREADGGHFDFQGIAGKTYNFINDTGFIANARFGAWEGRSDTTVIKEMGVCIAGAGATSLIKITAGSPPSVQVNGQSIENGQTVVLADGGSLVMADDGKSVKFLTAEGYQNTVIFQGAGENTYLDYAIRSGAEGVASDGRLPKGLLGHTFDADTLTRNGRTGAGAQGEGAIDGVSADYEVGAIQIQHLWNQTLVDQTLASSQKTKKLERLLQLALAGGNLDLAMLLLSGLETSQANEVAAGLMGQIRNLQDQRKQIANQMGQLGRDADPAQLQSLNLKAGDVSTEIGLLQTFLQDVAAQKNEAQAMASNFLKSQHDTAMGIIRNI